MWNVTCKPVSVQTVPYIRYADNNQVGSPKILCNNEVVSPNILCIKHSGWLMDVYATMGLNLHLAYVYGCSMTCTH